MFLRSAMYISSVLFLSSAYLSGQTGTPSEIFNEYNIQPEVWQFSGSPQGKVDNKGDLNLSLSIMTVPGRGGLNYDISFSYHAPIQRTQPGNWIGLGWGFDPGSITRDVKGGIEDVDGTHSPCDFDDIPSKFPDIYNLSLPGRGSAAFSRSNLPLFTDPTSGYLPNNNFEPLNSNNFYFHTWRPWKVDYTAVDGDEITVANTSPTKYGIPSYQIQEIEQFVITDDNGYRFVFGKPSLAYHNYLVSYSSQFKDTYVNTWRIEAILSPEFSGNIPQDPEDYDFEDGNWIRFEYAYSPTEEWKSVAQGSSRLVQLTYLSKIITPTHEAEFITEAYTDMTRPSNERAIHRKLKEIKLFNRRSNPAGVLIQTVKLTHDNSFQSELAIDGKLKLLAIDFEGQNEISEPGYSFEYVSSDPDYEDVQGIGQWQDDFGFYDDGGSHLNWNFDANALDAEAWSLQKVNFPTGGSESYTYENDYIFEGVSNPDEIEIVFAYFKNYRNAQQDNVASREYDFKAGASSAFRQGGTRVKTITRSDANGNQYIDTYTYGFGLPTGVPPKYFERYASWPYYTPGDLGEIAVVYEWVKMENNSISETRYFSIPGYQKNGDALLVSSLETIPLLYVEVVGNDGATTIWGNDNEFWGRLEKTHQISAYHDIVEETQYSTNESSMGVSYSVPNSSSYSYHIEWQNLMTEEHSVTENDVTTLTSYEYKTSGPRLVWQTSTTNSDGKERVIERTYAYEVGSYEADFKARNILQAIAREDMFEATTSKHFFSKVTTWLMDSHCERSFLKPYREYQWLDDIPSSTPPDFTYWVSGTPGPEWKVIRELTDYDCHGQLIEFRDHFNNATRLYYGDNTDPFSNTTSGLENAYLTGAEKENLSLAYEYDNTTSRMVSKTDSDGNRSEFYHDYFGRLAGLVNPEGLVLNEHTYFTSGDETGATKSYIESLSYPNGNFFRNASFEIYGENGIYNNVLNWNRSGGGDHVSVDKNDAILGNSYAEIVTPGILSYSEPIDLKSGQEYIFSCWLRTASGSGTGKIIFRDLNGKYTALNTSSGASTSQYLVNDVLLQKNITTFWERIWFKFRATSDATINIDITSSNPLTNADALVFCPLQNHFEDAVFPDGIEPVVSIAHFDGLGRGIQSLTSSGPYRNMDHLVYHRSHDDLNRVEKEWKPYSSDNATSAFTSYDALAPQKCDAYYNGASAPDAEGYPYSYSTFYGSGKNQILTYRPPGKRSYSLSHYVQNNYDRNQSGDAIPGYLISELFKQTSVDEAGITTEQFTDKLGRTVVERRFDFSASTENVNKNINVVADAVGTFEAEYEFIVSFDQTVNFSCSSTATSPASALVRFYEDGANMGIGCTGNGSNSGTFTAEVGKIYRIEVEASSPHSPYYASANGGVTYSNYLKQAVDTRFEYDIAGNLTKVLPPNSNTPPTGSSAADWQTTYDYNSLNQIISKTSPDAGTVQYKYDSNGNLRYVLDENQAAASKCIFTRYDFANRPIASGKASSSAFSIVDPDQSYPWETLAGNWFITTQYDAAPDPLTFPYDKFPATDYPSQQNLLARISAVAYKSFEKWQIYVYSYDAEGRVIEKTVLTEGVDKVKHSFTYTAAGELLSSHTKIGDYFFGDYELFHYYFYDGFGRLDRVVASPTALSDPENQLCDVKYEYAATGQIQTVKLKETSANVFLEEIEYEYTIRDWVSSINDAPATSPVFKANYVHMPNGNILQTIYHNSSSPLSGQDTYRYRYNYDPMQRLLLADYEYDNSGWQAFAGFDVPQIGYDPNGNILSLQRYNENGTMIDNLSYGYDVAGSFGNALQTVGDQVQNSSEKWDVEANTSFTYDGNGNVVSVVENGATLISDIDYDERNLPVMITWTSGKRVYYRYNSEGQRISRQIYYPWSGYLPLEHYIMDGDKIIGVMNENSFIKYWNLHALDVIGRIDYGD